MSIRSRVLNRCFNLLYGPLVFLHDPAGACLFGPSWDGRRVNLLACLEQHELVLDAGCGAGGLLSRAHQRGISAIGIDPSWNMLSRAHRDGLRVVQAYAQTVPIKEAAIDAIVISYPGPWIRQPAVWAEFARVLQPGGTIHVLLGGTVERGRGSRLRLIASRLLYGHAGSSGVRFDPPLPNESTLTGSLDVSEDEWGTVFIWRGSRGGS